MMWKLFVLFWCVSLASCGWFGGKPQEADKALDEKSSLQVLKEADKDEYEAPADGRLTEAQIQMYLSVHKRALELAQVAARRLEEQSEKAEAAEKEGSKTESAREGMKALGKVGDVLTADLRAAQELGYNTAEYTWVKGEVVKAYGSSSYEETSGSFHNQALEQLQQAKSQARGTDEQKFFDEQIATVQKAIAQEQAAEAAKQRDPKVRAMRHNMKLVAAHRAELDAILQKNK